MSKFTPEQRREILARARATLAQSRPTPSASTRGSQFELVYKTHDADDDDDAPEPVANPVSNVDLPWWEWVERHVDYRQSVAMAAIGQVIGEFDARAREDFKREIDHLRRELVVLREELGLERELRELRAEVKKARGEVPKFPAIAARLETELDTTKQKLGKVRAQQSQTDYSVAELRKEIATAKATAKTSTVEFETSRSRFTMKNIHPGAAKAMREFAAQVVDAHDGGSVLLNRRPVVVGTA